MQTTDPTDAAQPAIDRNAVEALHNRAKQLALTQAALNNAEGLRFAQGAISELSALLASDGPGFAAQKDASMGDYQPLAGFEAAWAALPDSIKNLSLTEVQEILRTHGVEVSTDTVTDLQVNGVNQLKNGIVSAVDGHNEHDSASADFDNSSGLHAASFGVVESPIVAQPPAPGQHWPEQGGTYIGIAPAEGTLPMRHLVVLDVEPDSRLTWRKAIDWALDQGNGARLPTQLEAMFAWTTARSAFKPGWHWTGKQHSRDYAFVQDFEGGGSYWNYKGYEHRVRAFRGLDLQTLNPLTGDAHAAPGEKI